MRRECVIVWVWFEIPLSVHEPATYFTSFLCSVSSCSVRQGTCTKWNQLSGDVDREAAAAVAAASTLRSLIMPRLGLVTKRGRECTITGEPRDYNEDIKEG